MTISLLKQNPALKLFAFALIFIFAVLWPIKRGIAQATFLISPYYGQKSITQGYGGSHLAIDYGMSYETVLAAAGGTVEVVGWWNNNCHNSATWPNDDHNCGFGLYSRINHGNNYRSWYAHLSTVAYAAGTTNGTVNQGQILGTSGNTGWSTGAHLHLQVQNYVNSQWQSIDPANLWKDGEWASPSRPISAPINAGEILVDDTVNSSNGFGFAKGNGGIALNQCNGTCNLWSEAAVGFSSHMFHTAADKVNSAHDQWARWKPDGLQSDGAFYEIFVHVPSDNATSWQAPFVVWYHDNAAPSNAVSQITTIDQYGLSNQWVSIGIYRMFPGDYVYTHDATGESAGAHCGTGQYCRLGADAVKFVRRGTVYAPDVRYSNSGGMTSVLIIRNNGGGPATYQAKFMNSDGTSACLPQPYTLAAHQTTSVICGNIVVAAAMIESNQDLSVLVRSFANGVAMLDNAFMSSTTGDPAFERTATTLYVPAIYNNIFSGLNSTVHIQNTTSNLNDVTLTYTPRAGYSCNPPCSTNFTLLGRGKLSRAASTFVGGQRLDWLIGDYSGLPGCGES